MGMISFIAKKTFGKIFKGMANDLNTDVENVKLGICYPSGKTCYEAYLGNEKQKEVALDDYFTGVDLSGGTSAIEATIGSAGPRFAKELSESLQKEVVVSDVSIIMKHKEGDFPFAVLMAFGQKQRMIDIEKEFLN